MTTYIQISADQAGGSRFFGDPVATFGDLPLSPLYGEAHLVLDTGVFYYWDNTIWNVVETEVATTAHANTDSIDLTTPGSILTATLNVSSDAATAGFLKATTTVKSGVNKGLHVEVPIADTSTTGVLTDTDWDTFNNKEPAITATTTAQYWRGDKSFQDLNLDAIGVVVGGAFNDSTKLLGIESASAGLGAAAATGVWGAATSKLLAAGTYIAFGVAYWNDNAAVITNQQKFGISNAADGSSIGSYDYIQIGGMFPSESKDYKYNLPMVLFTSAVPFTIYLNTMFEYSSGTPQHGGKLIAIRIR